MSVRHVKSVVRVFDILKLFHQEQTALRAIDVAKKLDLPIASIHQILKTMTDLDFITYGEPKGMYKPSNRLPEIVEWVRESVCDDPQLSGLMDALKTATRENIILAGQAGPHAKIYGSLPCLYEFGVNSARGTLLSPTESIIGIASLSHFTETGLTAFFETLKRLDPKAHKVMNSSKARAYIADIQKTGRLALYDFEVEGIGAICCPVLSPSSLHGLVIGIIGPTHRLKSNETQHMKKLKSTLRKFNIAPRFPIKIS